MKKPFKSPELEIELITVTDIVTESSDGKFDSMDGWSPWK